MHLKISTNMPARAKIAIWRGDLTRIDQAKVEPREIMCEKVASEAQCAPTQDVCPDSGEVKPICWCSAVETALQNCLTWETATRLRRCFTKRRADSRLDQSNTDAYIT